MVQYQDYSIVNTDYYEILKTDNILPLLLAYLCMELELARLWQNMINFRVKC
jgi:hypothetical protein